MAKGTLKYKLYQWKDNRNINSEPMWHARAAKGTTIEFEQLVEHMSEHNSPYSKGVIKGVLTDMLACVKELVLDNKSVRLGDLELDFESDYRRSLGCLVPDSFLLEKSKYSRYIVISG